MEREGWGGGGAGGFQEEAPVNSCEGISGVCSSWLRCGTHVQVVVSENPAALLSYTPLCFFYPLPRKQNAPPPPSRAQLCRTRELNVFKGVRRGPSNPQRRLGSGSPASRFIASVLPKSYFTVPSIRSLGSPQLPSPDAGLSPSLGTRAGHGEREACDTHQQAQHRHQHRQKTNL